MIDVERAIEIVLACLPSGPEWGANDADPHYPGIRGRVALRLRDAAAAPVAPSWRARVVRTAFRDD